jgi:uncharacterized protein YceK
MGKLSGTAMLPFWLLCLSGCSTVDTATRPSNAVVFHYQHVANVHEIRFSNPVQVARRHAPVDFVTPRDASGFWAIFVVCSIDTRASVLPAFRYDVDNFRIQYRGQTFGPLRPYTLRYGASVDLNTPAESPAIASAIDAEVEEGPATALFERGVYPGLDYRFAVYVPRPPPDYAGEQLALSYVGQPAVLFGNSHPPSDIRAVGGTGAGIAARCLPTN